MYPVSSLTLKKHVFHQYTIHCIHTRNKTKEKEPTSVGSSVLVQDSNGILSGHFGHDVNSLYQLVQHKW